MNTNMYIILLSCIGVASTSQLGGPHIVKDEMQSWASAEHAKLGCAPLGKLDSDIEFWTLNLK